jgi:hypothetical protein
MAKMDNPSKTKDLEAEEDYQLLLADEEHRADRSPAEWWEEDHLERSEHPASLTEALNSLVSIGCRLGDLLESLEDIEFLSGGYNVVRRRQLPGIIKRARALAVDFARIEMSPLAFSLPPPEKRVGSEALRAYAEVLEQARKDTQHVPLRSRQTEVRRLLRYVDGKVRARGKLGKRQADKALALLLSEVTQERWSTSSLTMSRSRDNRRRGIKRTPKPKKPVVRRLLGSRARGRVSKVLSLDQLIARGVEPRLGNGGRKSGTRSNY